MNDSLSAQLCSAWSIPAYARGHVWVATESDAVRAEGARGLFTLSAPADEVIVRWGSPDGPALRHLRWMPDALDWDGSVAVGGYIDAVHTTELPGLPEALAILFVGGAPLRSDAHPFPTGGRRAQPIAPPAFAAARLDIDESVTTWLALDGSPALALAQDALVTKLRVHLYGRLVEDRHPLAEHVALPIALEAITVFAT
jgi:hypothetical protein